MSTVRKGEPILPSVGPMTGTIALAVPQFCKQRPGDLAALESATVTSTYHFTSSVCYEHDLAQEHANEVGLLCAPALLA
jgi:hypothetical protein